MRSRIILLLAFASLLIALHVPFVRLPLHWDELGQFVPSALDLFRDGTWVTTSAEPNIHPPGLSVLLAAVWSFTGYSLLATRLTMLLLAALGAYLAFLLAIRLARGTEGAPAFAAVAFLLAAPMFYTQSMMVLLDMPAMVFTLLALLLFLDARYVSAAIACTLLVLVKETAITTPMVFGAWLWFRERRYKDALLFVAPALALMGWLLVLRNATGSIFGSAEFARYNLNESLAPLHILNGIRRRIYTLFVADGHWIGAISLWYGWKALRTRDWAIAGAVALAQTAAVTIVGGATLDRYLLPVLPILYAAFAVAASTFRPKVRLWSNLGLIGFLLVGWHLSHPYQIENNLTVLDFVEMQREAAQYIESNFPGRRVASTWPFTAAIRDPDYGYVQQRIYTVRAPGLHAAELSVLPLEPTDLIVLYSRGNLPPEFLLRVAWIRDLMGRFMDLQPEATSLEMNRLGYVSRARWARGDLWIEIFARPTTGPAPIAPSSR